jgi:hypothetical protein
MSADAETFDLLPNSTFRYAYTDENMFVTLDNMAIARRRVGRRGQLAPGFYVSTSEDYTKLMVNMDVEREGTFHCEMTTELAPWIKRG